MEITHESLLSLGFTELVNRPTRYQYKGVTGRLNPNGSFEFHGFSHPIILLTDIKWMKMMIDHQPQPVVKLPRSDN